MPPSSIAIIGAGIAGVAAGRALRQLGHEVVIFEKSRGFGGRVATKRWEGGFADHGASVFSLDTASFRKAVEAASPAGKVLEIKAPVVDMAHKTLSSTPRFYHTEGNSQLVRELGEGLRVEVNTKVDNALLLLKRNGGSFDQVLSTAPLPQTANLFQMELGSLPPVKYSSTLTGILAYRGELIGHTRSFFAIKDLSNGPLAFSACENHKTGHVTADRTVIVAHMSEDFTRKHIDTTLMEDYPTLLREHVEKAWSLPPESFVSALGHRWRYGRVTSPAALEELQAALPQNTLYIGDAVTGSNIEDIYNKAFDFGNGLGERLA